MNISVQPNIEEGALDKLRSQLMGMDHSEVVDVLIDYHIRIVGIGAILEYPQLYPKDIQPLEERD